MAQRWDTPAMRHCHQDRCVGQVKGGVTVTCCSKGCLDRVVKRRGSGHNSAKSTTSPVVAAIWTLKIIKILQCQKAKN